MIIDITERILQEDKIHWSIQISNDKPDHIGVMRNEAKNQIMIFISTNSFEKISYMKELALKQAREDSAKGIIEYA